jgi:hypothetical protein
MEFYISIVWDSYALSQLFAVGMVALIGCCGCAFVCLNDLVIEFLNLTFISLELIWYQPNKTVKSAQKTSQIPQTCQIRKQIHSYLLEGTKTFDYPKLKPNDKRKDISQQWKVTQEESEVKQKSFFLFQLSPLSFLV